MGKDNLIVALKNALERGETLEDAKESLSNAGYSSRDIELASREIEKLELRRKSFPKPKSGKKEILPPPPPKI